MGVTEVVLLGAWVIIIVLLWTCNLLLDHVNVLRKQVELLRRLYRG